VFQEPRAPRGRVRRNLLKVLLRIEGCAIGFLALIIESWPMLCRAGDDPIES
jgi:hypothetical protein